MRWLALDVGAKRVGLALSDTQERVVTPQATVPFVSPQALAQLIAQRVRAWCVDAVLVGVPVTRSGESRGEARARAVMTALAQVLPVPVVCWDERGTTWEAQETLKRRGWGSKKGRDKVDAIAAALLLEDFLSMRRQDTAADGVGG